MLRQETTSGCGKNLVRVQHQMFTASLSQRANSTMYYHEYYTGYIVFWRVDDASGICHVSLGSTWACGVISLCTLITRVDFSPFRQNDPDSWTLHHDMRSCARDLTAYPSGDRESHTCRSNLQSLLLFRQQIAAHDWIAKPWIQSQWPVRLPLSRGTSPTTKTCRLTYVYPSTHRASSVTGPPTRST